MYIKTKKVNNKYINKFPKKTINYSGNKNKEEK